MRTSCIPTNTPANFCKCGCGTPIPPGNTWVRGHHRRGVKHTKEAREKISKALKGNTPWNKGIPRTEEERQAISRGISEEERKRRSERTKKGWEEEKYDFMYGETNPACRPEVREKIGNAWRGRSHAEETKEKIRKARLGKPGRPFPENLKKLFSKRMKEDNPMYRKEVLEKHPVLNHGPKFISEGEDKVAKILQDMKISYERQKPLKKAVRGYYMLDFFLPEYNVIIEFDGHHSHVENPERDKERDEYILKTYGYPTLRIKPLELNNRNRPDLIEKIRRFLNGGKTGENKVN